MHSRNQVLQVGKGGSGERGGRGGKEERGVEARREGKQRGVEGYREGKKMPRIGRS